MGTINTGHLQAIGVFGYGPVEAVILAALVSGDPLLLIGRAGTGKTYLLNSLSEALGLEHRHYNASLIAFDDLVGFPWPNKKSNSIRYLETPATVWKAESVLIDEINRCKPEHQNRLFSLVHERRVQGIKLDQLRYRWAAMNPATVEQDGEQYAGCEPLDAALADRFAFLVEVADWADLEETDQCAIADPRGEGARSPDDTQLREFVAQASLRFAEKLKAPDPLVIAYCCKVATALGEAGLRISPRRVRQLARNILAIESVSGLPRERLFRLALTWSLPQRSGSICPDAAVISACHRLAWDATCTSGVDRWLHEFHSEPKLDKKIDLLLKDNTCPDVGTLAVSQLLAHESPLVSAVFTLALYPLLLERPDLPVGAEGVQDLGRVAIEIFEVEHRRLWPDRTKKPYWKDDKPGQRYSGVLETSLEFDAALEPLRGKRKQRAKQLFAYCFALRIEPADLPSIEKLLERCIATCRKYHNGTLS